MSAGKGDVIKFSEIRSLNPNSYKTQYLEEMTRDLHDAKPYSTNNFIIS